MSNVNYSTAMWSTHPKEESHMAQPLDVTQAKYSNYSNYTNYTNYLNYLNYLKLVAGKFHHLFGGQFFFDSPLAVLLQQHIEIKIIADYQCMCQLCCSYIL